jgi:lauroyl/myristoyl acyltransferase
MALTKAEIAEALFNQLGLNKREARELVDLFFEKYVRAYPSQYMWSMKRFKKRPPGEPKWY